MLHLLRRFASALSPDPQPLLRRFASALSPDPQPLLRRFASALPPHPQPLLRGFASALPSGFASALPPHPQPLLLRFASTLPPHPQPLLRRFASALRPHPQPLLRGFASALRPHPQPPLRRFASALPPHPQPPLRRFASALPPHPQPPLGRYPGFYARHPRSFELPWYRKPVYRFFALGTAASLAIAAHSGSIEIVPISNRSRFILFSPQVERNLGQAQLNRVMATFRSKVLPADHPDTLRIRRISNNISDGIRRFMEDQQSLREELSDLLMEGVQFEIEMTQHLEDLKWEVFVVNSDEPDAFALPGRKIVVYTGLLASLESDDEIATIIAHEVAHVVARHTAEKMTKRPVYSLVHQFLRIFFPNMLPATVKKPFSKMMEMEADEIGTTLTALAGYDPRLAIRVYHKLKQGKGVNYQHRHPSCRKRMLFQTAIMDRVLSLHPFSGVCNEDVASEPCLSDEDVASDPGPSVQST